MTKYQNTINRMTLRLDIFNAIPKESVKNLTQALVVVEECEVLIKGGMSIKEAVEISLEAAA